MMDQALKVKGDNSYSLVCQYSRLMSQVRIKEFKKADPEVKTLLEKTTCLNKIIGSLKPNSILITDLQGLDLADIKLDQLNLHSYNIIKTWLSETVIVPDYPDDNRTELFQLWADGIEEYQRLWNAGVDLITGVNPNLLRTTLEKKVRLGVDLSNGYLTNANLEGAHLENAKLQNANLQHANFQRAHLEHVQLQDADLYAANFQNAYLENVQLKGASLILTDLQGAHLKNVQLRRAHLRDVKLKGAYLKNVNIRGAKLYWGFRLPNDCKDEDLMDIYDKCTNQDTREQLKDILIGKGLRETKPLGLLKRFLTFKM